MGERERLIEAVRVELEREPEPGSAAPARLREIVTESLIEVADSLLEFEQDEQVAILDSLPPEEQAVLIDEAPESVQDFFLEHLHDDDRLATILQHLAPDDAADLVDELSDARREQVLRVLDQQRAETIRELASYDPDTAGGLMTTEFLAVTESTTVRGVKDLIRESGDLESIHNIFVTSDDRLLGVFSARQLILADNDQIARDIMTRDVISVETDEDVEEVYRIMETYHLSSLPVVDQYHDLVGLITFDDVLTVGEQEATEDVFRMAGSSETHPTHDSVLGRAGKRLPYLLVSAFGGFGSALVLKSIGRSEVVDEVMYFLPMIAMLGGNIATQSSAVMVRGFATGEVDPSRIPRVLLGEMLVGITVGITVAVIGGTMAYVLGTERPLRLALAVLTTIASLSSISSLLGTTIPSVCHKLNVDPAISAGPFITTLIDVIGCAVYMGFVFSFRVDG